ncbi:MAG: hypothetical protein M1832_000082 [Thelocarpon impressellum]|nr:MAG: hypothetical protein M1832_000082 [Thelocarpon impressellum]
MFFAAITALTLGLLAGSVIGDTRHAPVPTRHAAEYAPPADPAAGVCSVEGQCEAEVLLLQVDYIQDGSRRPDVFRQDSPTFVADNQVTWDDPRQPGVNVRAVLSASRERAAIFSLERDGNAFRLVGTARNHASDREESFTLTVSGSELNGIYGPNQAIGADRRWKFDEQGRLLAADGQEPPWRICRLNYAGNMPSFLREFISLAWHPDAGGRICQNIHLHRETLRSKPGTKGSVYVDEGEFRPGRNSPS